MITKAIQQLPDDEALWDEVYRLLALGSAPISREVFVAGARAAGAMGAAFDFDSVHQAALRVTRTTSSVYWRSMAETTRDGLREALTTWQEQGLGKRGLPDLANALEPLFSPERAKRIAQTETTRLFAEGNIEAARGDDTVGGMQWQTMGDALVRPAHAERHNKIYPMDALPPMGEPNCRCSYQPATWAYIRANRGLWQGDQAAIPRRGVA